MKKGLLKELMKISLAVLMTVRPFSVFAEEETEQQIPDTEETAVPETTEEQSVIPEEEPVITEEEDSTVIEEFIEENEAEPETDESATEPETDTPKEGIPEESEEYVQETVTEVNDAYDDVLSEDDLDFPSVSGRRKLKAAASSSVTDIESAGEIVQEGIKVRTAELSIAIEIPLQYEDASEFDAEGFNNSALKRMAGEIMDAAMVYTGVPNEGDYIKYQYGGYKSNMSGTIRKNRTTFVVTFVGTLKFTFDYYTDAAQEEETARLIDEALEEMDIESHTEIEKIRRIYDFICTNTSYDYENLNDDSYKLKYTAYAAIHDHTAVCQGYAALFYRMALTAGLEARVFSGIGGGDKHAWNAVKVNDLYYLLDSTWDSSRTSYAWFLKSPSSFRNHTTGSDDYNQRTLNDCTFANQDYVPLQGITVSDHSLVLDWKDETYAFTLSYMPENATVKDMMIENTDPQTAVYEDGTLKIKGYGETIITFKTEDGYYTEEVSVKVGEPKELTVTGGSGSGTYYPEREIEVSADTPSAGERFAYWDTELEPASGYTVQDNPCVFVMSHEDASAEAVYEDIPAEKLVPEFTETELKLGTTLKTDITVLPAEAVKTKLQWSSSDTGIVGVLADGTMKAVDFGTAVITAEADNSGVSAVIKVTVYCDPGLASDGKGLVYRDRYGKKSCDCWKQVNGSWYYFGEDGYAAGGWLYNSGKWYYMSPSGVMQTGWVKDQNSWYYFHSSGAMAKGWEKISGSWYFLDRKDGKMHTGWLWDSGSWYWLKSSGAMAYGWQKINNLWYYMNFSGVMQNGWLKLSGKWYYLNSSGAMVTGWKKIGSDWYYFDSSGVMQAGKWIGKYHVDSSGKWDATR